MEWATLQVPQTRFSAVISSHNVTKPVSVAYGILRPRTAVQGPMWPAADDHYGYDVRCFT
jgi:hypothetical protein